MIFSSSRFSSIPFSHTDNDQSVASIFSGLIANQEATRAYLLDASPYDPVAAAEIAVGYSQRVERTVMNGRAWPARLKLAVDSQVELFGDDIDVEGRATFGNIEVLIGDKPPVDPTQLLWDGRDITVLMGAPTFDYSQYQPIFKGMAENVSYNDRIFRISLRSKAELLDVPVLNTFYGGTGGLDGGSDLAGTPKPGCWGSPSNVAPVLIDRTNQIYQVHDGSIEAVLAAYDGAAALTPATPADVSDITTATPPAGQYTTQLSGGYIKLGAEPAKLFTVDLKGDNSGGYVETAADVVRRIVENRTDLTSGDLDLASFASVNVSNSAKTGIWSPDGTVRQAVTDLIQSIGGSWTFTRQGVLKVAVFEFSTSVGVIAGGSLGEKSDIVEGSLNRLATKIATWRRSLGYARSWTVQNQDDVVASATNARKDFVSREYRLAVSEDVTIKTRRKLARDVERQTLLTESAAASAEATRQQTLFGADRNVYEFVARNQQFRYAVGQTITVNYPRFGFPRDVIIMSLRENTNTKRTTFRVWG